jgi:hypothetical protein
MTVAPVVVNPEADSNRASIGVSPAPSTSGQAPSALTSSQNSATIKKPSRTLSSAWRRKPVRLNSRPMAREPAIG